MFESLIAELENSLQLGDKYDFSEDDAWKKDWSGNLALFQKDVVVNQGYVTKHEGHGMKPIKVPFHEYVAKSSSENHELRGLELLLSYVYHTQGCPRMAQRILANALRKPANTTHERIDFIIDAIRRTTYDPLVLEQDGWTTKKADTPEGSMGGANLIGRRIIWERHEAIICAFTPDEKWGSLWKAIYVEDLETFDMEADEVQEGLTKYEKKLARIQKKNASAKVAAGGATRKQAIARFLVEGIEHGIVLALPSKSSSKGVMWPARVMHVSEMSSAYTGSGVSVCVPCCASLIQSCYSRYILHKATKSGSDKGSGTGSILGSVLEWQCFICFGSWCNRSIFFGSVL